MSSILSNDLCELTYFDRSSVVHYFSPWQRQLIDYGSVGGYCSDQLANNAICRVGKNRGLATLSPDPLTNDSHNCIATTDPEDCRAA